ncbi:protein of unknown function [Serratia sp. Tan611]|nr:protein of unknown function [Serratia sp. Tan611]
MAAEVTNHADYSDSLPFVIEYDCYLHLNLANQRKLNHYAAKKDVPNSPFVSADCPLRWLTQRPGGRFTLCLRQGGDDAAQARGCADQRHDGQYRRAGGTAAAGACRAGA